MRLLDDNRCFVRFRDWLDRPRSLRYRRALFWLILFALYVRTAEARDGVAARSGLLPPGSTQVGENRFRSPLNYADTLNFYSKHFKNNPRKTIVNQPGIRAIHIVNDGKGDWEGLNVYEKEEETRIFVVPRDSPVRRSGAGSGERGGQDSKSNRSLKGNR